MLLEDLLQTTVEKGRARGGKGRTWQENKTADFGLPLATVMQVSRGRGGPRSSNCGFLNKSKPKQSRASSSSDNLLFRKPILVGGGANEGLSHQFFKTTLHLFTRLFP